MIFPDFDTVEKIANEYDRVTIYREMAGDLFTPISLLKKLSDSQHLFLLESAGKDKKFGRYSFLGKDPKEVLLFKKDSLKILNESGEESELKNISPMQYMQDHFFSEKGYNDNAFGAFTGGYVGFFNYESMNDMKILRERVKEEKDQLYCAFFKVNQFYVFDNHKAKLYAACSIPLNGNLKEEYENAVSLTEKMVEDANTLESESCNFTSNIKTIRKEYDEQIYKEKIAKIKEEIKKGEAIQVVFSNAHEVEGQINPLNFYRTLRNLNPSPYLFYLKLKDEVLLGSSPEIHLKVENRKAIIKPIAGTYPLSGDLEADKKALLEDPKELAEHLMLIDLARNDLYTKCITDSVVVEEKFVPEVYSHVLHIVSLVSGTLKENETPLSLFMKTFPAGTLSGAPKVRAIELINQYEDSSRGFYGGCVGYIGYEGNLDTCITIRSALVKKDKVLLRAGGGIVHDSLSEKEFNEVNNKLKALVTALQRIENLENQNVFTY